METIKFLKPKESAEFLDTMMLITLRYRNKIIYLTFDEGYEMLHRKNIRYFKRENVTAAFFFSKAIYNSKNPEIIKRMNVEGHLVC